MKQLGCMLIIMSRPKRLLPLIVLAVPILLSALCPRISHAAPAVWTNVTSNLANLPSGCGNVSYISAKPDEDMLITSIGMQGLYSSVDGGTSWQKMGAGSPPVTHYMASIVYDPQNPRTMWESGIYGNL